MTRRLILGLLGALLTVGALPAAAATFRWASASDVASLDPYSRDETLQLSLLGNVYEPLIRRGRDLRLEPALATGWRQVAPLVWRFELRPNVRFQDGTAFTAADVVFSYRRAIGDGSKIHLALSAIRDVRAVDAQTVDIVTATPDPLLPEEIVRWNIMSAAWCQAHGVEQVTDAATADGYAADHANGTGPFAVESRVAGKETVFVSNPSWWGKSAGNVDRAIFQPIADNAARLAALTASTVDMIVSVPPEDIGSLMQTPGVHVVQTASTRTILLGFRHVRVVKSPYHPARTNPLADRRVRAAFAQAIDENTIATAVMRGLATPAGLIVGPGVRGFDPALNQRPEYDPAAARRLLAAAGYPNGFALIMDCPNDRYRNDAAICVAVAANLAKIGVRVTLLAQPRSQFFTKLLDPVRGSDFYLIGWRPANDDALDALINLAATRSDSLHTGAFNFGGYSNPALDALIAHARRESLGKGRAALLRAALAIVKDDVAYIPLHQLDVVWAVRNNVAVVQRGDDTFALRDVRMK
ncbi:MAG: ABC transporter substrate-binding protein [Alphaproteobacteria bacterium]|nr:ABC transporter substrate-binding protein [Alphaproteobacteria bacterium]